MKNIIKYIFLFHLLMFCAWAYPSTYTLRGLSVSDGLSDLLVNAIYKDSLGFVWIGTGNSLERFDGSHIKHYPITGSNEKLKRVNVIAEMEDNQLWMGNGMGLWRLNKELDALELIVPDMINCAVHSLLHDGKGTLYIGSAKGLFLYKKGNLEQILLDKNALSASNVVTGLSLDEQGMLWMATEKGLYSLRLSDRKVKAYHNVKDGKHVCAFNNITRIGSTIYLGTMDQGIISFDTRSGEFEHFVEVGCNIISSLSSDGKNMLYVGTDGNGVHFIATDRRKVVRTMRHETGDNESLRSNSVYSLLVDRNGMIWIGFYQLGLDYTLYQSDLFTTYAFPPYFNSRDMPIRALAINGHEKLVGSRDGLFYIDEKRNRFKSFQSPEMRSGMIFCILFYEGEYYVGTYGGGMYIFNPERLTIRDFAPDGEQQPFVKGHIFCIKQDAEGNMSYEYQLEGRDDGWIAITGRSEVTYYDLPSGSYVFKVRRMGEPDSETLLKVEIASVFSGWLAWGIVVAVLLAGGGYYFFGRGKRQAPEQVQVVKEEQSVAVETKSVSEEKYKSVKVSSEECRRLTDKLEKIMHKDKLYKHSDLKIADLAAAIDTSAHTLSYLFNQYLERNYYDYINDYRIAEFKRLVNTEEYSKYTLSALAELCGFSSRASFFRYFKKATGITPNEYIRSIGGNNE